MIRFNLNDHIYVKLTSFGKDLLKKDGITYLESEKHPGYMEFQTWCLMRLFGQYMNFGSSHLPIELNLIIGTKEEPEKRYPSGFTEQMAQDRLDKLPQVDTIKRIEDSMDREYARYISDNPTSDFDRIVVTISSKNFHVLQDYFNIRALEAGIPGDNMKLKKYITINAPWGFKLESTHILKGDSVVVYEEII